VLGPLVLGTNGSISRWFRSWFGDPTTTEVLDALQAYVAENPATVPLQGPDLTAHLEKVAGAVADPKAPAEPAVIVTLAKLSKPLTDSLQARCENYKKQLQEVTIAPRDPKDLEALKERLEALKEAPKNIKILVKSDWHGDLVRQRWQEHKNALRDHLVYDNPVTAKAHLESERRLYESLDHPGLVDQRQRLLNLFQKGLYVEQGRASPQGISQVTELQLARTQLDALEAIAAKDLSRFVPELNVSPAVGKGNPFLGSRHGKLYPLVIHYDAATCNPDGMDLASWVKHHVEQLRKRDLKGWSGKNPYVILIEDRVINQESPDCGIPEQVKAHTQECVR